MSKLSNAVARRYLHDIRNLLPWVSGGKRKFLSDLRSSVECFLLESPEADRTQLEDRFGTPKQIASSYMETLDLDKLRRAIKLRKVILWTVGILAAFILITWLSTVVWAIIKADASFNGYHRVELT